MANELEILTENAASDGWVDSTPGAVSTGYQAQNTAIQAHSVGEDKTYVYASGSSVIVAASGLIDINGLPFKITSDVSLTPASAGTWYIRVVPGADSLSKSLELTDDPGTWSAVKNGLYDSSGRRVLNWVVVADGAGGIVTYRLIAPAGVYLLGDIGGVDLDVTGDLNVAGDLEVSGGISASGSATVDGDEVARVYDGSAANETDYPIGTIISVSTAGITYARNATATIYYDGNDSEFFVRTPGVSGENIELAGTWRCRGRAGIISTTNNNFFQLFQRVS